MKSAAGLTRAILLMVLSFGAGWQAHQYWALPLATPPASSVVITESPSPVPSVNREHRPMEHRSEHRPEHNPAVKELPQGENPAATLTALLTAQQYQKALDFYRERLGVDKEGMTLLYPVILDWLKQQRQLEQQGAVLEFSRLFLLQYPQDYPVSMARAQALLARGERREAIELLYAIVHYLPEEKIKADLFEKIHQLVLAEYDQRSAQGQWRDLDRFYQYLLTQENTYDAYYLHYAAVLMKLEKYAEAENYLLPLLTQEEFAKLAREMLNRLKLLRAGGAVLPLQKVGTSYISPVVLNDSTRANFLLDTGASLSVMSPDVFAQLSPQAYALVKSNVSFQTANGAATANIYRIHTFQLGEYRLENVEFAVLPVSHAQAEFNGLLGMNILKQFRFEIDQMNQELVLQPHHYNGD